MAIVGEAYILIRPDTTPFVPELEAKLQGAGAALAAGGAAGGAEGGALAGVAAGAEQAAATVDAEGAAIGASVTKLANDVEQASTKSSTNWLQLGRVFSSQTAEMTGGSNALTDSLGTLDRAGLGATASITGAGTGATAATGGLLALAAVVAGSIFLWDQWGESVFRVQQLTGVTGEQASRIVYAFNAAGISINQVAVFLGRFSRNLESGNLDLQRYGLEVAHTANGAIDLNGTLLNLADAMQRLGPGTDANTLAISALGRGGAALVPILIQGRQALLDLEAATPKGDLLSTADAERAHQFSVEMRQLVIDAKAAGVALGHDLAPAALFLAQVMDNVVKQDEFVLSSLEKLGKATLFVTGLDKGIQALSLFGIHLGSQHSSIQQAIDDATHLSDAEQQQADAIDRAQQKTKDLTDELNAMATAADKVIDEERAVADARNQREIATTDLQKAEKEYNDLLKVNGADVKAQAEAERSLASARTSLRDANRSLVDSEQAIHEKQLALNEAIDEYGKNSEEARKAQVALDDANNNKLDAKDRIAAATDSEQTAQDNLTKSQGGSVDSLQRLADAKDKVTQKSKSLEDAVYQEARANSQLATDLDTASGKTDTARDKTDAYRTALEKVRDSLDPASPLRKNLQGYIDQLGSIYLTESRLGQYAGIYAGGGGTGNTYHSIFNIYGSKDPAASAATIDALMAGGLPPPPNATLGPTKQAAQGLPAPGG